MRMSRKMAVNSTGGLRICTLPIGTVFSLTENSKDVDYIVLAHNYQGSNGTLVVRKYAIGSYAMNSATIKSYHNTDLDLFLNDSFILWLDKSIREKIVSVALTMVNSGNDGETIVANKKVFLLCNAEVGGTTSAEGTALDYFSSAAKRICYSDEGAAGEWWTRTAYYALTTSFRTVSAEGELTTHNPTNTALVRPAFVLPHSYKLKLK